MAGIYFHIPFCKQACHYCDFHFSTSLKNKDTLLEAMLSELRLQDTYLEGAEISSIYFGGGTPSLLAADEIQRFVDEVAKYHTFGTDMEVTLEANPDDLSAEKVNALSRTDINRFSIGIQSFHEADLRWMNRAHNASEAKTAIARVQDAGFENITADLIYGYPLLTDEKWADNIDTMLSFGIPHVSAYGMTVEPRTALASFINKGVQQPMDEEQSARNFEYLMMRLAQDGYVQYEISNFAKPASFAYHNSNYWKGVPYLGIGPSAHSFDGHSRQWNVANNAKYIKALKDGLIPSEKEVLTEEDVFNEYVMTSLRTIWGIDLDFIKKRFDKTRHHRLTSDLKTFVNNEEITIVSNKAVLTPKGKLIADRIASDLFC